MTTNWNSKFQNQQGEWNVIKDKKNSLLEPKTLDGSGSGFSLEYGACG